MNGARIFFIGFEQFFARNFFWKNGKIKIMKLTSEKSSICSLICSPGYYVSGTSERQFFQSCGVDDKKPAWKHSNGTVVEIAPKCDPEMCLPIFEDEVDRGGDVNCTEGLNFNSR